jgi:hypothetical protein
MKLRFFEQRINKADQELPGFKEDANKLFWKPSPRPGCEHVKCNDLIFGW